MGSHTSNNFNRNGHLELEMKSPYSWSILVCDCYGLNKIWVCFLKDNILGSWFPLWLCWYDELLRGLKSHVGRRTAEVLPRKRTNSSEKLPRSSEWARTLAQKENPGAFWFPVLSPDPFPPWCHLPCCELAKQTLSESQTMELPNFGL